MMNSPCGSEGNSQRELLFSGGAGAICFQIGYLQHLVELIGKETLKTYLLGGVSAGAAIAGLLHSVIYSDVSVEYIYVNKARQFYEKENQQYKGLITNGHLIYQLCKSQWEDNMDLNLPSFNNNVHVYTSYLDGLRLKPMLIDTFKDSHDFASAMKASAFLPLICGLALYSSYRDKKCVDGGCTMPVPYKHKTSYKIFLNMMPDTYMFIGSEMPDNTVKINIYENSEVSFPIDYYVWNGEWADEMYVKGYRNAQRQAGMLKDAFGIKRKEEEASYTTTITTPTNQSIYGNQ